MKTLSKKKLHQLLNVKHVNGTPEQVRVLAVRIGELVQLNGEGWVESHAVQLLSQWDMVLGGVENKVKK